MKLQSNGIELLALLFPFAGFFMARQVQTNALVMDENFTYCGTRSIEKSLKLSMSRVGG